MLLIRFAGLHCDRKAFQLVHKGLLSPLLLLNPALSSLSVNMRQEPNDSHSHRYVLNAQEEC